MDIYYFNVGMSKIAVDLTSHCIRGKNKVFHCKAVWLVCLLKSKNTVYLYIPSLTTAAMFLKRWKAVQRAAYLRTRNKVHSSFIFSSKHNTPRQPAKLHGHQHSQPPRRAHGANRSPQSQVSPGTGPSSPACSCSQWDETGWQSDTQPAGSLRVSHLLTQFPTLQAHNNKSELGSGIFPGSKPEEGRMGHPHTDLTYWRWISSQEWGWDSPKAQIVVTHYLLCWTDCPKPQSTA